MTGKPRTKQDKQFANIHEISLESKDKLCYNE